MFHYLLALSFFFAVCGGSQWPIPYNATNRPEVEPECKPLSRDFCNDGLNKFPVWSADDTISLYALVKTKKVLENTVMGYFIKHMTSYSLGFLSKNTGKYYTLSWEPLSGLNDTIAPRILPGGQIVWCNQAAACLREDRNKDWTLPIGHISGEFIDIFEVWVKHVNNTMPFLQEFLIYNKSSVFLPNFDSAIVFMRAINMLKSIGAKFANLTFFIDILSVVGHPPIRLGTEKEMLKLNPSLWGRVMEFYGYLQPPTNASDWKYKVDHLGYEMITKGNFYYYFNGEYWHVTATNIPLDFFDYIPFSLP